MQFLISAYIACDPSLMPKVEILKKNSMELEDTANQNSEVTHSQQESFSDEIAKKYKQMIEALSGEIGEIVL